MSLELLDPVADRKAELADLARQRNIIHANTVQLKAKREELKRAPIVLEGAVDEIGEQLKENAMALQQIETRALELKAELHELAQREGAQFERAYVQAAKKLLPPELHHQLIEEAQRIAGLPDRRKSKPS